MQSLLLLLLLLLVQSLQLINIMTVIVFVIPCSHIFRGILLLALSSVSSLSSAALLNQSFCQSLKTNKVHSN